MIILNRTISNKTEQIVNNILSLLNKPIIYNNLGIIKDCFGQCCQNDTNYFVWLDDTLPEEAFETNLVHELIHLTQMKKMLPDAVSITEKAEGEIEFAKIINSTILDLEVEEKIKEYGLKSIYFSIARLKQMKSARNAGFVNFANNDFLQKFSAIRLALYAYVAPKEIADQMFSCFLKKYPRICSVAKKIQQIIDGKSYENTVEMFETMKAIIELLDIGEHIKVIYNKQVYKYSNATKQWYINN